MENVEERRHNYYIKKRFQRNFILQFCILVIVGSLISGAIIYGMSSSAVTTTFENSKLTIKSAADYILPSVILSGAVVVLLIGIATIFITLFTSHKIAGPLYRIEKDVGEIASGNLKVRFNLRSSDEVKPLAASLDNMAQILNSRISAVKRACDELESKLGTPEAKNKVKDLRSELEKFYT
jgi:methyl-accepting chemotaxis protein